MSLSGDLASFGHKYMQGAWATKFTAVLSLIATGSGPNGAERCLGKCVGLDRFRGLADE